MTAASRLSSRLARLSMPAPAPRASEPLGEPRPSESVVEPRPSEPVVEPRPSEPVVEPRPIAPPAEPRPIERLSFDRAPSRPAAPPRAAQPTLDDLRARIDALVARTRAEAPRPPPRADTGDLPFAVESSAHGPLTSRTVRHGGEHRIGRVPVASGRRARADLLALLALDPRLAGCDPARALYLDTETTGLGAGAGTIAFLIGLAWFDVSGPAPALVVEQLLVRRPGEEAPVLARVAERLREASMLVTFNGKSFDMPVLRARFVMGRMSAPPEPPHLDLVHVARRLHKSRGFGASLGAVEREVLGFVREGDVPSSEVSAFYLHWLRTGDPRALLGVVEHNAWDVVSMAALVGLYGEPLSGTQLAPDDLVGVARTLKRAGAADLAFEVADEAASRGAGHEALRARAEIAKARGDKARALADFEALASSVDDPSVRLELAKLYEHHTKEPARALAVAREGTGEPAERRERREARLERKLARERERAARRLS